MAQVTKDMCEHIIAAADRGERFPLTANEMRQLGYLAMKAIDSAATVAEPSPFKRYTAFEQAGKEASERTAKLHEYLAKTSGEKSAQQPAENLARSARIACGMEPMSGFKPQPLGAEFDKVMHDNLSSLYIEDGKQQAEPTAEDRKRFDETTERLLKERTGFAVEVAKIGKQAEPGADERAASEAYDKVDRFLRNNLDDADYAEYSEALDCVLAAQSGQRAGVVEDAKVLPFAVLNALRFYANGSHFCLADETAWDTVSGEPQNFWCDEAGTATVEDGSIAKAVLQGVAFTDGDNSAAVDGEVYTAQEIAAAPTQQQPLERADMSKYIRTEDRLPPDGEEVMCIDSGGYERTLKRKGNLWWFPDDSMYVYFVPVAWKPLPNPVHGESHE